MTLETWHREDTSDFDPDICRWILWVASAGRSTDWATRTNCVCSNCIVCSTRKQNEFIDHKKVLEFNSYHSRGNANYNLGTVDDNARTNAVVCSDILTVLDLRWILPRQIDQRIVDEREKKRRILLLTGSKIFIGHSGPSDLVHERSSCECSNPRRQSWNPDQNDESTRRYVTLIGRETQRFSRCHFHTDRTELWTFGCWDKGQTDMCRITQVISLFNGRI